MNRSTRFANLNLLADIQESVESLSESNYNDCLSRISESPLFRIDFSSISRIIYFASRVRPLSTALLIKLAIDLCKKSQGFRTAFLEDLFSNQYPNTGRFYFLFKCFEHELFSIDVVSTKIDLLLTKNHFKLATSLFAWFAPELETSSPEQFHKLQKFTKPPDGSDDSYEPDILQFWEEFDTLKADNWMILKERRENGLNHHELIPILLKDDLVALKAFIDAQNQNYNPNSNEPESENHPFDPNQIIHPSCYDRIPIFQNQPTILCCAAYFGADHCCHALVEAGADKSKGDQVNRTPSIMTIAGGASQSLTDFLTDPDNDPKIFKLLVATSNHRNEYVRNNYANLEENAKQQIYGGLWHQAAGTNNIKAGLFMQGQSENVNLPNQLLETPLHYAAQYGNIGMIDLLLSFESTDINAVTNAGKTPCHLALKSFSYSAAKLLIENPKMNPLIKSKDGMTPFHLVICQGYTDLFYMILEKCPELDINMPSYFNRTPLISALMYQSLDIAKALIQNPKVNVNLAEDSGRTPLHLAILLQNMEIINMLLDKPDIDLTAIECYQLTPYDYAVRTKYQEGIDRLQPLMPPSPPEEPKPEETQQDDANEADEKQTNKEKKEE